MTKAQEVPQLAELDHAAQQHEDATIQHWIEHVSDAERLQRGQAAAEKRGLHALAHDFSQIQAAVERNDIAGLRAIYHTRQAIRAGLPLTQADIEIREQHDLKDWRGAQLSGRTLSGMDQYDLRGGNIDFATVRGSIGESILPRHTDVYILGGQYGTTIKRSQCATMIGGGQYGTTIGGGQYDTTIKRVQYGTTIGGEQRNVIVNDKKVA